MKKFTTIFKTSALFCGGLLLAAAMTACGDENDDTNGGNGDVEIDEAISLDYTKDNADSWHNYATRVADLLARDSKDLYESWTVSYDNGASYAEQFRNASGSYKSYVDCIDQIIEGCADIANEVGEAKIGDPYNLYVSGKTTEALYAVESWYSWHSREDYQNNIYSVRNSYYGTLDGKVAEHSLSNLVQSVDPTLNAKVIAAIDKAANAIYAIPQPFRNNISSGEASLAMDACADLYDCFDKDLKSLVNTLGADAKYDNELKEIVANYVDVVVLTTYKTLMERNEALLNAIKTLGSNRTDAGFKTACDAWLSAREPWERSEAFLFGPVDALGLDPNMDSWPLDQVAIVNHLKSGNFSELEWGDGDDDDRVEAAQNIRGFHTLEYLLFKDGQPRKVNN